MPGKLLSLPTRQRRLYLKSLSVSKLFTLGLFLIPTWISSAVGANPEPSSISLFYSQAGPVWTTIHDIKRAEGDLPAMNRLLNQCFGKPEEMIGGLDGLWVHFSGRDKNNYSVRMGADTIAYGSIQNPVVPELHAVGVGV